MAAKKMARARRRETVEEREREKPAYLLYSRIECGAGLAADRQCRKMTTRSGGEGRKTG